MFFQIITASATIILKDCSIDGDYTIGKANIHDWENFKEKWR